MKVRMRVSLVGGAASLLVAAAPGPVTAIRCVGPVRAYAVDESSTADEARLYVLNDERRMLMRHNVALGLFEDLCEPAAGCRLDYGSEMIALTSAQGRASRFVLLNRSTGTVVQIDSEKHGASVFEGSCVRTQLAKPESSAQF